MKREEGHRHRQNSNSGHSSSPTPFSCFTFISFGNKIVRQTYSSLFPWHVTSKRGEVNPDGTEVELIDSVRVARTDAQNRDTIHVCEQRTTSSRCRRPPLSPAYYICDRSHRRLTTRDPHLGWKHHLHRSTPILHASIDCPFIACPAEGN